ncbi:hypothetical protein FACS1894109_19620 [Spirochaetia bacterium]|nr:hypothetical protein FACS1894109_19620 [Spirochaetia bacterium]
MFYQWAIKSNMVFEGPDGTRLQAQYSIFAGDAVDVSAETIDGFVSRFAAPVFARGVVWGKLADDLIQHPGYIDISGVAFRDKIRDVKTAAGITATMIDEAALIAALASFWHCIRTQSAMCEARKQKHGGQQEKELPKRIPKVLTARPGCPFPQKTRSERPKGVDELMRYLSDDQPDFILVGFWDRGIETEAFFIPATGPRHTLIFWYKKHWQTGNFQGCCLGRAIRKAINWDDPDCYCTDALHLLPPNPDHRAEYLARKEKAMRVAR